MPERAPLGQLPRSVDVVMDNDLVDKAKPGDRVQVVGVYRALAGTGSNATSGVFRTVLIANCVRLLSKDSQTGPLSPEDVTAIRTVAKRKDVVGG
jgi:DNA replication licensing factor MCM3